MDGDSVAEPQYSESKISVWWDIENCCVPRYLSNPSKIAKNIRSALHNLNYCGTLTISAYGNTSRIPFRVQEALSSTAISINHVPSGPGKKDTADKKMLVDMMLWALDNPAPANYFLISGDRDFSNGLHQLRFRRYNILLAQPAQASPALVAAATSVWLWTDLINGRAPLSKRLNPVLENRSTTRLGSILLPPSTSKTLPGSVDDGSKLVTIQSKYTSVNPFTKGSQRFLGAHGPVSSTKTVRLSISGQSNSSGILHDFKQGAEQESKSKVVNSVILSTPCQQGSELSSDYIEDVVGVVLIALDTLKLEKIVPTKRNISDYIRYGDPQYRDINVKQALFFAVRKERVQLYRVGEMPLYYLRTNDVLWECANPRVFAIR